MGEENTFDGILDAERYRVKEGQKVDLSKWSTVCDADMEKEWVKAVYFPNALDRLKEYQEKLFAQGTYGLIIVLQAMDAAGKDSTINHVFSNLDPGGVNVVSFKEPTSVDLSHDYMWRINKALPPRGNIGVFNRSHYEDVVITRIHNLIGNGSMPRELIGDDIWETRYEQINNWEKYLYQNGFPMVKIFLHVSKKKQQERLVERILNQKKNWKFALSDISERQHWEEYQKLYGEMITATSKEYSPWYIVPADNKWFTRYVVALIALRELKRINPKFPKLDEKTAEALKKLKELLAQSGEKNLDDIHREMTSEKEKEKDCKC